MFFKEGEEDHDEQRQSVEAHVEDAEVHVFLREIPQYFSSF